MKNDTKLHYELHPDARLRLRDILGLHGRPPLLSIGRTKFYALVKSGKLPAPDKIGSASVWRFGNLLSAIDKLNSER
jgi:predicted DNA-binding transcriptional regulator AlpA